MNNYQVILDTNVVLTIYADILETAIEGNTTLYRFHREGIVIAQFTADNIMGIIQGSA